MGRGYAHLLQKGGMRLCIKKQNGNGNALIVTHTDEQKLQTESRYG